MSHKNEEGEPLPGETAEKRGGTAEERPRGMTLRFQQPRPPQTGEIEKYPLLLPETAGLVRGSEAQAVQDGSLLDQGARLSLRKDRVRDGSNLSEAVIQGAISRLLSYLKGERERYWPQGRYLNAESRAVFGRFFSQELLREVRVVALSGRRLTNPPFYDTARKLGIANLPDLPHTASVTFLDVIVFNEQITNRGLFHSLVHAAQVRVFGPRFFTELYVRGVMRVRSYSLAPMKAQAFALDTRFASNPEQTFSVEGEIRTWFNEARY